MIPGTQVTLMLPEQLLVSNRLHNKLVKELVREELQKHHKVRIPQHFQRSATKKYGYAKRISRRGRLSYYAWKQKKYGSNRDLVKTGDSEREMKAHGQVTVAGAATGGNIDGRLKMRFNWRGGTGRVRSQRGFGVGPEQMVKEVQAMTPDEVAEVSLAINLNYGAKIVRMLKEGRRIRLK